jgi:hypothetical protein
MALTHLYKYVVCFGVSLCDIEIGVASKLPNQGILKGEVSIDLLFDWFRLVCFADKNKKIVSCQTADSKPVKQDVNRTVILPPLVFPGLTVT